MEGQTPLIWSVLFGVIGVAFFSYGKKQRAVVPLMAGVALCLFPCFISSVYILVAIGAALIALPYFVRI